MSLGSGFGPATCWITHKGLETWARLAKERHKSTPTTPEKKKSEESDSPKENQASKERAVEIEKLLENFQPPAGFEHSNCSLKDQHKSF